MAPWPYRGSPRQVEVFPLCFLCFRVVFLMPFWAAHSAEAHIGYGGANLGEYSLQEGLRISQILPNGSQAVSSMSGHCTNTEDHAATHTEYLDG